MSDTEIDWTDRGDVEWVPGRVSGQWTLVGTRILADGVIDKVEAGVTFEELAADIFPGLASSVPGGSSTTAGSMLRILLDENIPAALRRARDWIS